jgi:hypothetical protein
VANNNKSVFPIYYSNLHKHLNHLDQCTHLQKEEAKEVAVSVEEDLEVNLDMEEAVEEMMVMVWVRMAVV